MALPPEEELIAGQIAYEQARAFEHVGARIPYLYAFGTALGFLFLAYFWFSGPWWAFAGWGTVLLLWYFGCQFHWQNLQNTYQANLQLLQKQRDQYGNDLPWVQVEQQLAALAEIERKNAEKAGDPLKPTP